MAPANRRVEHGCGKAKVVKTAPVLGVNKRHLEPAKYASRMLVDRTFLSDVGTILWPRGMGEFVLPTGLVAPLERRAKDKNRRGLCWIDA